MLSTKVLGLFTAAQRHSLREAIRACTMLEDGSSKMSAMTASSMHEEMMIDMVVQIWKHWRC